MRTVALTFWKTSSCSNDHMSEPSRPMVRTVARPLTGGKMVSKSRGPLAPRLASATPTAPAAQRRLEASRWSTSAPSAPIAVRRV